MRGHLKLRIGIEELNMSRFVLVMAFGLALLGGCDKHAADDPVQDINTSTVTVITIDESQMYQSIDGFGASLTDSSAWLLANAMTPAQRQAAQEELFDPEKGIGLTYLRQPMGTSDFRVSSEMGGHDDYTYNDMPRGQSDYELSHFSIAKDEKYIIPMLQEILAVNPEIKLMGSPWSAPHWMKQGENLGGGRLKEDVYDTYARYFVKYIQAYAEQGLTINAITLQNEPWYEPGSYHGTRMEPADQIKLVKKMGPLFAENNLNTDILVWDHNWDQPQYPLEILNDPGARKYVAGTAWHHYYGDVSSQTKVHDAHPDRDTHFTEGSNGQWQKPGFDNNLIRTTREMMHVVRNWSKSFITWNLALDTQNGPKIPGGCDTCYGVITIDQADGSFSRRPQYYTFGHTSKFVRPGAYRVDSTDTATTGIENVAFMNTDGSRVLIALNSDASAQNIKVEWNGKSFKYPLPTRAVATFVWNDQPDSPVRVWLTTGDQTKLLNREADLYFSGS
jgi:glucosylceramidase